MIRSNEFQEEKDEEENREDEDKGDEEGYNPTIEIKPRSLMAEEIENMK
jgi:hypothetical protein